MNTRWHGLMAACSGILLLALTGLPEPAHAQLGGIAGMIIGHIGAPRLYGPCGRHCHSGGGKHSRDDDEDDDTPKSSDRDQNERAATLTPPSSGVENALLRNVAQLNPDQLAGPAGDDGTSKSLSPIGKAVSKEGERDWTEAVQKIIKKFTDKQDKGVTTPGDVTEHAIEQSLENAITNAKLNVFESFLGENWTTERLRSLVLDLVSAELDSLFKGNSRGYAPMQEVDNLIQHSAQATYRRIFEVSELMAANRSSALFVQRLYQTHGAHANDQLREDASDMIQHAATATVGKYEAGLRQNENGYALRYRAERIVFDCLSDNVEKISSSETDIAEKGEIAQRIEDTSNTECFAWLQNQFGPDLRSIKPQKPVPLRVVWSADGPKDDPSMYGQATNEMQ